MKNKIVLHFIIVIMSILAVIAPILLVPAIGNDAYHYLLRPFLWMMSAAIVFIGIKKEPHAYNFNKHDIRELAFIGSLIYVILYFLLGLLIGYSRSPLDRSLLGILENLWLVMPVIISREIIRNHLFKTSNHKKNWFLLIYLTIFFISLDINVTNLISSFNGGAIITFLYKELLPSVLINTFLSYLVYKDGVISALLYKIPYTIVFIVTPIYLKNNYALILAVQIVALIYMYIKIEATCNHNNLYGLSLKITWWDRARRMMMVLASTILLLFTLGFLSHSPIVIASNSMYPVIHRGDIVVSQKVSFDSIEIGDIIVYDKDNISIIHRVVDIKENFDYEVVFITKGDNNTSKDSKAVLESQFKGKIVMIVPKIGYPTLWFNEFISGAKVDTDIEMGDLNE